MGLADLQGKFLLENMTRSLIQLLGDFLKLLTRDQNPNSNGHLGYFPLLEPMCMYSSVKRPAHRLIGVSGEMEALLGKSGWLNAPFLLVSVGKLKGHQGFSVSHPEHLL